MYVFIDWHLVVLGLPCCVGFSLGTASWGYSLLPCVGFSVRWRLLLWSTCSRHSDFRSWGSQALGHRLRSCGAWASLPLSMWDLPESGIELVSTEPTGGFFTTELPRKCCVEF